MGKSAGVLIAPFINDYFKCELREAHLMKVCCRALCCPDRVHAAVAITPSVVNMASDTEAVLKTAVKAQK